MRVSKKGDGNGNVISERESADSLDMTLFRLPVLALSFYSTNSGHHFAGFPVAIETRGICVNCALVNNNVWN